MNESILEKIGENLTEVKYLVNPAIARDKELKELVMVLLTPEKSAVLVGKPGIVNVYEFDFEKVKQDLRILIFEEYNTEWLDFIIKCRNGELIYQDYDVIAGGIADDKVFNTVELYLDRLISKEEALGRLKYYKPNFQICIVNQEVIDNYLTYKESRDV